VSGSECRITNGWTNIYILQTCLWTLLIFFGMSILWRVGWYTPLIRRVLVRIIGFISSYVTHVLLVTRTHRQYSAFAHLHHLQITVAHALEFSHHQSFPSNGSQHRNYNSLIKSHIPNITQEENFPLTLKAFNSHDQFFPNYVPSTVVSNRGLTRQRASVSLINPWYDTRENASIFASLLKRVTSLLTRSRDPSPLLRHPNIYSCCLATNEPRRCDAMGDSSRLGSARLGTEKTPLRLLLRNRGSVFRFTVLAWRKYSII
jgi:hypothetical protein